MNNKEDNSFKMYNDEESKKLKKNMTDILTNVNSQLKQFMEKYKKNPKLQPEIDSLIYHHPIFDNKKNVQRLWSLIKNSGEEEKAKLEEIKKKSKMHRERQKELNKIKDFVNQNYLKMLPEGENKIKKLPDLKEEKVEENSMKKEKEEPKKKNPNIIADFTKNEEEENNNTNNNNNINKEGEDKDDIIIEDIPKTEYLSRKRKKNKNKLPKNESQEKGNINFYTCYICKTRFTTDNIHKFYSNLCTKCGDYNYSFRTMKLDLTGRIAIVTGGRVKIGYYIATQLLNYNCKVLITSRFPKDTLLKYEKDPNYNQWKNNLLIYPIDFRLFESTVKFVQFINDNFPHIDILINNAAQTIRRTAAYYKYLLPIETKKLSEEEEKKIIKCDYINLQKQLDSEKEISTFSIEKEKNALISLSKSQNKSDLEILPLSVIASQIRIMEEKNQPINTIIGNDGQPYDFSQGKNSWNLELDEIPFQEFTEVQIINTWTPYYLCIKLKDLMIKSPYNDRYIINVTSVEGIFNHFKRTSHPHTNMAKAALNMLTRTCGDYYKKFGIYMSSVDTGWVSPMNEINRLFDKNKKNGYEKEFTNIPLDELDGAMRVLHPIIEGVVNKNFYYGCLLKDYRKSQW